MENKKQQLIKRQQFVIRAFKTTLAFFFGYSLCYILMDKLLDFTGTTSLNWSLLKLVQSIHTILVILLVFEIINIIYLFLKIGKKEEIKPIGTLDQLEKLGKLKAQGLITEEEFEKEKKKLWEQ